MSQPSFDQKAKANAHKQIQEWYEVAFKGTFNQKVTYFERDGKAWVKLTAILNDQELAIEYPRDDYNEKLKALRQLGEKRIGKHTQVNLEGVREVDSDTLGDTQDATLGG